jgi:hypothetical protein
LRAAHDGAEYDLIHGSPDAKAEAVDHLFERGRRIVPIRRLRGSRQRVTRGAFDEFQLVDIARKGGLGDFETSSPKFAAQLILARDGRAGKDFPDCVEPEMFHFRGQEKQNAR